MNSERLLKLATHLESGNLGHDIFDFGVYHQETKDCGTLGCAIGECPYAFPDEWEMQNGCPIYAMSSDSLEDEKESGMVFFDINGVDYVHLFVPESAPRGGLSVTASRHEVADNIRKFVARSQIVSESPCTQ